MRVRELVQNVVVLRVDVDGSEVYVDGYGATEPLCVSVHFTFDEAAERAAHVGVLQRWADEATPVSMVVTDDSVALVDDRRLLDRALEPAG